MKKVKVGIIGVGRIGKLHAGHLAIQIPEAEVVAIADPLIENVKKTGAELGIKSVTGNYRDILSNPEIEAVIICSPTDTHAKYTIEAASAGKHIFCEKPLDLSLGKIREVLKNVEKSGVKLMPGFNRRFDPDFAEAKNKVNKGVIGDPHVLKITSRDPQPPPPDYIKISGGIFLDMTIHDFDMMRFIMDAEVEEVYAKANVLIDKTIGDAGDVDTAVTTLYFKNGTIGVIDNSRQAVYGYDQRLEVFGSDGVLLVNNKTHDTNTYINKESSHNSLPLNFFMDRYIESYVIEMRRFIKSVAGNKKVPVSGEDGLLSVALGLAAKKSVLENRPVKMSEIL